MATASRRRTDGPLRSTLVAAGLAIFGLIATQFTTLPALLLDPKLLTAPTEASITSRTVFFVLNFLAFVLVGAIYIAVTDRGWSYVDVRFPTRQGWAYVLVGIVASIAFYVLISVAIQLLSLPAAENQVASYIGSDQTMILVMIGIVFFFNAPAEEFLYRNVVQKRLYDAFSRLQAVGIASLIFGLIHWPVYALLSESLLATAVPVAVVVGGAVIFGFLYAKTDNLFVPIIAHAVFNGVQFGLLYLALEYEIETAEPTTSLLVDLVAAVPL
ncbi:CPBP family intramembrane glutamic endopeptidase [Natrinema longum]|uniref:CPBP family intramembrane metalloprotease n=1 Tax=Natrinema longum TaxID=370324 RepID=A0A8A2UFI3_9EURY|nr:CPBP family intramembrane glutamic endopeptidase [Natrinema longum]MBZ6495322.1 CPBP family intramembrane metalloprotease [Natrinema longum]QSW86705.1 CPBP family intramembrane metalloprotease [Natrinema longum]